MKPMAEEDNLVDYSILAHDYIYEYLFKAKVMENGHRPPTFGEYESAIKQYEGHITEKHAPAKRMIENIKADIRLADLIDDEDEKPETCPELPEHIRIPQHIKDAFAQSDTYRLMLSYIDFSRKSSPRGYKDYHPFCFLWLLSTIAARRIYFQFGRKKVYTNLRIALCGGSTGVKKSFTAEVAISLLREELGLSYLLIETEDMTPEALIMKMVGKRAIPDDYKGSSDERTDKIKERLAWSAQKSMYWDEFGMFLRKISKETGSYTGWIDILLKVEECKPITKSTAGRGDEIVEKPYLPFLGNIVAASVAKITKKESDLQVNGLMPRQITICTPDGEKSDDRTKVAYFPGPPELVASLLQWHDTLGQPIADIIDENENTQSPDSKKPYISNWTGVLIEELPEHQCKWTEQAETRWYEYGYALEELASIKGFPEDLATQYSGRLTTITLRIAMLFASIDNRYGRPEDTIITDLHMAIAQELTEIARQGSHRFYEQVNGFKTLQSKMESEIVALLKTVASKAKTEAKAWITVAQIRSRLNEKYGTDEIKKALKPLEGTVVDYQTINRPKSKGAYRIRT